MESFWDHVGIILGSFWDHVGIILGSFWNQFGIIIFEFFPQHIVEGLLNSRPREIAIIAGFAFSGPPRATGDVVVLFFFCTPT